jgi:hypothetical protein
MEPADLNSSPERDDARLEAWLRQPTAPLPDDGFSQRVLAALPPSAPATVSVFVPAPARLNWRRLAVCTTGAIIGGIVAYSGKASFVLPSAALDSTVTALGDPTTLAALAITVAAVLYALRPRALVRLLP